MKIQNTDWQKISAIHISFKNDLHTEYIKKNKKNLLQSNKNLKRCAKDIKET